jgi:hypothetical protein
MTTRIKEVQLNNKAEDVKKIPGIKKDEYPPLGEEYLPFIYGTTLLIAATGTGKTTALFHMLKNCVGPYTEVILFVGTLYLDKSYEAIVSWLKKNKILYILETTLKGPGKTDQLSALIKYLELENPSDIWDYLSCPVDPVPEKKTKEPGPSKIPKPKPRNCLDNSIPLPKKQVDPEIELEILESPEDYQIDIDGEIYSYPKYIFIIDDLPEEIRKFESVPTLSKKLRHFMAKLFICVQDVIDIQPSLYTQTEVVLAFSNIPHDKKNPRLQKLYENMGLSVGWDTFLDMYLKATETSKKGQRSRNFLYINRPKGEYGKNFKIRYDIST